MATSGSFYNYPVKSFGLYCEWSAQQSITGNYTDVTLKIYRSFWTLECSEKTGTGFINGSEFDVKYPSVNVTKASSWQKKLVTTKTIKVDHGTDGKKKSVKLSASWPFYGKYSGTSIDVITASDTVDLDDIDRSMPTVSFSVANITTNSLKITATASTKCNSWDYSLDNGSTWKNFSTTDTTSASKDITGLSVNTTYNLKVRARRSYNHVYGTSASVAAKTLGNAAVNSCAAFYVDTDTVSFSPNVTVYEAWFTEYVVIKDGQTELTRSAEFQWSAGTANRTVSITAEGADQLLLEMPKAEKVFTLVIETYDGEVLIGTSSCPVTLKTSVENSGPVWDAPCCSIEDKSDCADILDTPLVFVQSFSEIVVTALNVSARNHASISSYTVTLGEKTVSSPSPVVDIGAVDTAGDHALKLTVTDSRGHSLSFIQNVTVLKYQPPQISRITLRRANGIDDVVQLSFSAKMSPLKPDGSTDVNRLSNAYYQYKLTSAGDEDEEYSSRVYFTGDVEVSSSGTSLSFQTEQLCSLDSKYSYVLRIVLQDRVWKSEEIALLPKGIPAVAIRKEKVGINTPTPQYALDVAGDIGVTGGIYRNGIDVIGDTGWIDLGLASGISETEQDTFGHYKGCAYRVVGGNHVYVAFNVKAVVGSTPVVVNNIAIPSEHRPKMQPYAIVSASGSRIARVLVLPSKGQILIDWIRNVADDAEPSQQSPPWIDGYLDYWI